MPPTPESEKLPRPRQVTLAAALVMGALRDAGGLGLRAARRPALHREPAGDRGVHQPSRPAATSVSTSSRCSTSCTSSRWWPPVCATAAAILGFHVLKRNRSAPARAERARRAAVPLRPGHGRLPGERGRRQRRDAVALAGAALVRGHHPRAGPVERVDPGGRARTAAGADRHPRCPRRAPRRRSCRRRPGRRTPPPSRRRGSRRPRRPRAAPPPWRPRARSRGRAARSRR